MRWRALQTDPLYSAYQAELNGAHMIRSARVGALVVAGLNTAFIFPDFWAHPDRFNLLLAIRLPWNLVMAGVYWAAGRVNPLAVARLGCLLTGAGMVCVIGAAGGLSGNYWPGIMILFLGMPVLLPLSALEAGGILGVLLVAFAGMPLVTGEALTVRSYLVPVCFAVGAALECVASCALLERLRFADFKQRRELERTRDELRELDQAKSRFTANIHHELRTPLTLTLAPLEGLMAGDFGELSQLQLSYMKTMHVNALRLLKLINNLLDLAKAESQQLALHRRRVDVGRLLEDVATGARPMAERKRVALETEGLRDLPSISVDPEALEKVIVNLIGNALKFTEEGGRIAVRGEPSDDGVQLVVADTGVGLPEDQLERIFDRFAQVDTSATRRYEGTGIGLSLSKELVEAHGGRIWAE
ncbi:MAG: HAMP domain-containing sensor histidine kinase, partial [Myxococcota bacterium]